MSHLDGSIIELERSGITQYGYVQTIKGLGMPHQDNHSQHGDLFVEYNVVFPTEIDEETIECKVLKYVMLLQSKKKNYSHYIFRFRFEKRKYIFYQKPT